MFSQQEAKTLAVSEQSTQYNGIDLMKFICSILVLMIHITPFPYVDSTLARYLNTGLQYCVCRIAVPFFFVCSGFFLFRKMDLHALDVPAIKKSCFKTLQLLGLWYMLLFFGNNSHLWYLSATVIAVIFVALCLYRGMKMKHIYLLALLLYAVGLLGDSYFGLIRPLGQIPVFHYVFKAYDLFFHTTRNGVFMGFIFVLMGATFSHCQIKLKPWVALAGLAGSILGLFMEFWLLKRTGILAEFNMYLFLLPAAFFLFAFASNIRLKDRPVYKRLRVISTLIYFLHLFAYAMVYLLASLCAKRFGINLGPYAFVLTLLLTLLPAVLIEHLSHKEKLNWLNWFIG